MDLVYVVKRSNRNPELAYSLRSVAANLPHDRVFIVGHAPTWVRGATVITTVQHGTKWANAHRNWMTAVWDDRISDPFVYMNDDFYVVEPIKTVPLLHRGELDERADEIASHNYADAHRRTAKILREFGRPTLCYELHVPMVMHKQGFGEALKMTREDTRLLPRSVYANMGRTKGKQADDVKSLDETVPAGPFLSSEEVTFRAGGGVGRVVRRMFPDECRYEATGGRR